MNFELTKEFLQELSEAVAKRNGKYVAEKIQDLHPADIAEIFDRMDLLEAQFIYELLEEEVASDVLVELEEDVRDKFLKSFTAQEIANQVDNMDSDDATDLIQDLSEERKEKVLSKLEDAEQARSAEGVKGVPDGGRPSAILVPGVAPLARTAPHEWPREARHIAHQDLALRRAGHPQRVLVEHAVVIEPAQAELSRVRVRRVAESVLLVPPEGLLVDPVEARRSIRRS